MLKRLFPQQPGTNSSNGSHTVDNTCRVDSDQVERLGITEE
jgi:hypothetical protein